MLGESLVLGENHDLSPIIDRLCPIIVLTVRAAGAGEIVGQNAGKSAQLINPQKPVDSRQGLWSRNTVRS